MLPSVVAWFVHTTAILMQQILMLPACPSKLTQVYVLIASFLEAIRTYLEVGLRLTSLLTLKHC